MDRYLVISNHTVEDCKMAINHFKEYHAVYLTHFEWGCLDDDHNAYAIVEADSHNHAKMAVPPFLREKAKVIKLTTFSKEEAPGNIHEIHK